MARVEDRALPSSGTIRLSEIRAEFGKGDSLTSYYGAASGVPSSGNIKLTDFYGKSDTGGGPSGSAPNGNYGGVGFDLEYASNTPSFNYMTYLLSVPGSGAGDPRAFPDEAGWTGFVFGGDYNTVPSKYIYVVPATESDVRFYNNYPQIYLDVEGQTPAYYNGSWSYESIVITGPGTGTRNIASFSNSDAGKAVYNAMENNKSFYISLWI